MAKWADFAISHKRLNAARTHIDKVRALPDNGDSLGIAVEFTRQEVISKLKIGMTFVTTYQGADKLWKLGEKVIRVVINNTEYIKTVADNIAADNLDNLPDF